MKKVLVVFIVVAMLTLCGCKGKGFVEAETPQEKSMFVLVEDADTFYIVYHRDTKVMYAISGGMYNGGSFCLLVNPDGTPMLWEGGTGST